MTGFPLGRDALLKVGNLVGSLHQAESGFQPKPPFISSEASGNMATKLMPDTRTYSSSQAGKRGVTAFDRLCQSSSAFIPRPNELYLGLEELSCYQEIVNKTKQAHYDATETVS